MPIRRLGRYTIIDKGRKGALLTMVERETLYIVIVWIKDKRADKFDEHGIKSIKTKIRAIAFHNGYRFACHVEIA